MVCLEEEEEDAVGCCYTGAAGQWVLVRWLRRTTVGVPLFCPLFWVSLKMFWLCFGGFSSVMFFLLSSLEAPATTDEPTSRCGWCPFSLWLVNRHVFFSSTRQKQKKTIDKAKISIPKTSFTEVLFVLLHSRFIMVWLTEQQSMCCWNLSCL